MDQVMSHEGDNSHAIQEYYHVGLDGSIGLSETDGVFLMELLEDSTPPVEDVLDDDVDRLSHVIRSLEAEIDGDTTTTTRAGESWAGPLGEDGGMLDAMLMDLDGYGSTAAFGYWPEVLPVGGWYAYTEGAEEGSIVAGYEVREQQYYYEDQQGSVEQVYSPLWE